MQSYTEITADTEIADSLVPLLSNDKTVMSCNEGTAFPTINLLKGMLCFRSDLPTASGGVYQLVDVALETWKLIRDFSKTQLHKEEADLLYPALGEVLMADNNLGDLTDQAAARANLGVTSIGEDVVTAANAAAVRTVLGATSVGSNVFTAADQATARTALGITDAGGTGFDYNTLMNAIDSLNTTRAYRRLILGFADAYNGQTGVSSVSGFAYDSINRCYSNLLDEYSSYVARLWRFNSDLTDSSGNAGTLTGVSTSIDTSVKKYGAGALRLTGGAAYAHAATGGALGSGDFTVDFWVYVDALGGYQTVFSTNTTVGSTSGLHLSVSPTGALIPYSNGQLFTTTTTLSAGAWHFVRLRRSGTTIKIYVGGADAGGSATNSSNFSTASIYIGRTQFASSEFLTGRLDDFRITVGAARDGAEVPSAEMPDPGTSGSGTLTGIASTTLSNVGSAYFVLQWEDVNGLSPTLNTEIAVEMSADGSNWVPLTLSDVGMLDSAVKIAIGEADFLTNIGTSPQYRVVASTTKHVRAHAIAFKAETV